MAHNVIIRTRPKPQSRRCRRCRRSSKVFGTGAQFATTAELAPRSLSQAVSLGAARATAVRAGRDPGWQWPLAIADGSTGNVNHCGTPSLSLAYYLIYEDK